MTNQHCKGHARANYSRRNPLQRMPTILICGEWEDNGLPGFARVWQSALEEVFSAAVPLRLQSSSVVATSLSPLSLLASFMAVFHAMTYVCDGK
jgi:hypothetical protein